LRVFFFLPHAAIQEKVDLLHVQYFVPPFFRRPVITTIHDVLPFRIPKHFSLFERAMFHTLLPGSVARSSHILTVSETSRRDLIDLLKTPPQKITVTYNAAGPIFANPSPSPYRILEKYGLKQNEFFLSVGRVDSRKNLHLLVDAFIHLKQAHKVPHKLVITGKRYFERERLLKKIQVADYASEIILTGYVPDQDLAELYSAATGLVLISESEGFGLPALEAMACGTPVIVSDIPIFHEILAESCLYVNPFQPAQISATMQRLILEPGLRPLLIRQGRERAAQFSWDSTAQLTLNVYKQCGTTA
jgi:glycosyltransferase involved in cell wall biosynthesis